MLTHLKVCIKDFYHTGSPLPSSGSFARMMTRAVRQAISPRRILEVGPGAGPMTQQIVRCLDDGDQFDVVEINADFARKVDRDILEPARRRLPGARIAMHVGPIQTVDLDGPYDFIVSSLPMNNFDPPVVREILDRYRSLLAPGGHLNFFEYAGIRGVGKVFRKPADRQRLTEIAGIMRDFDRQPGVSKQVCLTNIPPAMMRSLVLSGNGAEARR